MTMPRISFRSRLAAAAAVATLAGGLTLATAGPASAYGNGEVYQVELSANINGATGDSASGAVHTDRRPARESRKVGISKHGTEDNRQPH